MYIWFTLDSILQSPLEGAVVHLQIVFCADQQRSQKASVLHWTHTDTQTTQSFSSLPQTWNRQGGKMFGVTLAWENGERLLLLKLLIQRPPTADRTLQLCWQTIHHSRLCLTATGTKCTRLCLLIGDGGGVPLSWCDQMKHEALDRPKWRKRPSQNLVYMQEAKMNK